MMDCVSATDQRRVGGATVCTGVPRCGTGSSAEAESARYCGDSNMGAAQRQRKRGRERLETQSLPVGDLSDGALMGIHSSSGDTQSSRAAAQRAVARRVTTRPAAHNEMASF